MANKNNDTDNLSQYIRKLEEVEKAKHKRILMYAAFGAFFLFLGFGTYHLISVYNANYEYDQETYEMFSHASEAITVNANTLAEANIPENKNSSQSWEDDNYNMLEDWTKPERDKSANKRNRSYSQNGSFRGGNTSSYKQSNNSSISSQNERAISNSTTSSIPTGLIAPSANSSASKVFDVADNMPTYPNGAGAMYRFIRANIHYPRKAIDEGIEGQVHVQFVVRPDGSLTNLKVVKSLGFGCDEEAIRIIRKMPKWIPGETRGKIVSVKKTVPVTFVLP